MRSDHRRSKPAFRVEKRLRGYVWLMLLLLAALSAQLFRLQVLRRDYYANLAIHNRVRVHRERALRGEILDRHGRLLVENTARFQLRLLPRHLPRQPEERSRVFQRLAPMIDSEPDWIEERYRRRAEGHRSRWDPLPIQTDLTMAEVSRLEASLHLLPGVEVEVVPRRHYIHGALLAHALGRLGEVTRAELGRPESAGHYQAGDLIGRLGIEKRWEDSLRGRSGLWLDEVDSVGRKIRTLDPPHPIQARPGDSLYLTIDLDLQRIAEEALGDQRGAVIGVEPRTGEILCMVSKPAVDPNEFSLGISGQRWSEIRADPRKPMLNRTLTQAFPPGSTFKPILACAGLETGVVSGTTRQYCVGSIRLTNRAWRCWSWRKGGHKETDLRKALEQSCNVYFYVLGHSLGIERIAHWARLFGLGERTGIGLDAESPGLVPDKEWKKRKYKDKWYPGETLNVSVGQGQLLVTPLQLALAYGALANGGDLFRPILISRLQTYDRKPVFTSVPELHRRIELEESTRRLVRRGLRDVVLSSDGTAHAAENPLVTIAGKTGTAQVAKLARSEGDDDEVEERYRDHNWFASFGPFEDPRLALVVLIENGGKQGSKDKIRIARTIYTSYFGPPEE